MNIRLEVTYLDGQVRAFGINPDDPKQFTTWYAGENEHGIPLLTIKRYPRPSASRVQIPLSLVRHYEVINDEEPHVPPTDQQCALGGCTGPRHPGSLLCQQHYDNVYRPSARWGQRIAAAELQREWARADAQPKVDWSGFTGTFYRDVDPANCEHNWQPATLSGHSNGIGLLRLLESVGPWDGCPRCGEMRVRPEPEEAESERDLPGQVAVRPADLGERGRDGGPSGSDGDGAGLPGVAAVEEPRLAAMDVPQGPLTDVHVLWARLRDRTKHSVPLLADVTAHQPRAEALAWCGGCGDPKIPWSECPVINVLLRHDLKMTWEELAQTPAQNGG